MPIKRPAGFTPTEKRLAELCDRTFLKTWAYPNPRQHDRKELCDVIAIFENHVFLFFDRESRKFDNPDSDLDTQWSRWEKEAIQKQLTSLVGAKKYILKHPGKVYLDEKSTILLPVPIPSGNIIIHKIVVANGASQACKSAAESNISGSLGIMYVKEPKLETGAPFFVLLDKSDPVHVFDGNTLEIVLSELDTFFDFTAYIVAKEEAIARFDTLMYCGEEDLLCHYFLQFDEKRNRHYIGPKDKKTTGVVIEEGIWWDFVESDTYKSRREANEVSYLWDRLLQMTCQNALDQVLGGNSDLFAGQSAIYEMAMEPRFSRRALSEAMTNAINNFPDQDGIFRNLSYMPSFYEGKAFVFLQLRVPDMKDYDEVYRPRRRAMLEIACGVTKNKFPHLNKVVGIAIDAPKFHARNSEDFILLNCDEWSEEARNEYSELNKTFRFFESASLKKWIHRASDFPMKNNNGQKVKVGRNERCPCGSGKKYKHCCI